MVLGSLNKRAGSHGGLMMLSGRDAFRLTNYRFYRFPDEIVFTTLIDPDSSYSSNS
jgi:hypothetical protein